MEVYDFMENQSIDEFMLSKLSCEELKYAKQQIQHFRQIPRKELRKKVNEEQKEENYEKLSMADSYVLHIISRLDFARSISELDKKIKAQIDTKNAVRQRGIYYASHPYSKK